MATPKEVGSRRRGDPTPVSGGVSDLSRYLVDLPQPDPEIQDELGREIAVLLALHADKIALRFRGGQLNGMDDPTKRLLLTEIREMLRIRPLRRADS